MRKFHFAHIHEIWYHARIFVKFHASCKNFSPDQASRTNVSTPSWYVIKGGLDREGECILSRWYWNNARQIEKDVDRGFISIPPIPFPSLFAHSRLLMMFTRNNKACNVNQVFCMIVLLIKRSAIEKGTEAWFRLVSYPDPTVSW